MTIDKYGHYLDDQGNLLPAASTEAERQAVLGAYQQAGNMGAIKYQNATPALEGYLQNTSSPAAIQFHPAAPSGYGVSNGKFTKVPDGHVRVGNSFVPPPTQQIPTQPTAEQMGTQQAQWVNDLYMKYFDRSATPDEMANWWTQSPSALDTFLKSEAQRYGYSSNALRAEKDNALLAALNQIDLDPRIPVQMKQYAKDIVQAYGGDQAANFKDIMATFDKLKKETIDPHYAAEVSYLQKGLQQQYQNLMDNRQLEVQKEKTDAGEAVRGEQLNLEARGLTNSGEAVRQLGQQSAIAQTPQVIRSMSQVNPGDEKYAQQGAEGLIYDSRTGKPYVSDKAQMIEGFIPQQNRIMASSSQLRYQLAQNQLGRQAEGYLGSNNTSAVPGYLPSGGILGSVEESRQQDLGATLQEVAKNQQAKNTLNTNQSLNLGQ